MQGIDWTYIQFDALAGAAAAAATMHEVCFFMIRTSPLGLLCVIISSCVNSKIEQTLDTARNGPAQGSQTGEAASWSVST